MPEKLRMMSQIDEKSRRLRRLSTYKDDGLDERCRFIP
jgi:hypothetical protein